MHADAFGSSKKSRTSCFEPMLQPLLSAPELMKLFRLPPGGCVLPSTPAEPLLVMAGCCALIWPPLAAAGADRDPLLGLLPSMRDRKLPEASSLPACLLLSEPVKEWKNIQGIEASTAAGLPIVQDSAAAPARQVAVLLQS
jgi:hypothetical protein